LDGDGMVCIERDYRARATCSMTAGIYLQGPTEHTHGIGSTLLSNTAVRAGEILASIVGHASRRRDEPLVGAGSRG
jgi:L-ornithine N5-oxygenase